MMNIADSALLLRGVRPYGGRSADILIRNGILEAIAPAGSLDPTEYVVREAQDLIMLPGLVDLHTHLREPGGEESETVSTGTRSAAAGGYTDVFAMANTDPVTDTIERLERFRQIITETALCRVHPVGSLTIGLQGQQLSPIDDLAHAGVTVFSDDGKCVDSAVLTSQALQQAAALNVVVAQHAQHGELAGSGQINAGPAAERTSLPPWPGVAEETIIARDALLAADTGGALHVCHVSTRRSAEVVRWAKAQGWPVTAEVTPHHLLLTDELAALADPRYKVNPPLRSDDDVRALREALLEGTIDIVATDHAPHPVERKARSWCDAPFGMTGLETALPVLAHVLTQEAALDWKTIARLMSTKPASIGRIGESAGRPLVTGEPATFTLIDPQANWRVTEADRFSKSGNTPFLDSVFSHRVVATVLNGTVIHGALH